MLYIDGSYNEGGGQILRTALALSTLTGTPFEMQHIRKGRKDSGLKNQHLHCIKVLQKYCNAKIGHAILGSNKILFIPGKIKGGKVEIDIGTAGSITLMLQSLLLPALFADKKTIFKIKGGTDVSWSPQIDYLNNVILPHLTKYAEIELRIIKRGYYPKGGGEIEIKIRPKHQLSNYSNFLELIDDFRINKPQFDLLNQGQLLQIKGISHASQDLENARVAERQANSARLELAKLDAPINIHTEYCETLSQGSGLTLWARFSLKQETDFDNPILLGADMLGTKGKSSENIGEECAQKLISEIKSQAPVDEYLADNLLPFLAINGGSIKTSKITPHTQTNMWVIEQFLGKMFKVEGNVIKV
ncbi:RNA 3'-terminal phosphate cyclase [Candidatus Woesearchaeota archaeon]|nr:RNA 3'-terminal phosphate cyclase [Candidatus Woesearchaeota archaeon]